MNIWSSPFIFFHRKRIKPPALSQHIHCYCCSALRNAYNKTSLFRVFDSCLQWSDFIHFQYGFAWKYLVWNWLGVAIICSWKLISFYACFPCAQDLPFLGQSGCPHASSTVLCISSCESPWMLCLTCVLLLFVAQRVLVLASPCTAVTGSQDSSDLQDTATQPLTDWGTGVLRFVLATVKWQDTHNILKGIVVA